MTEFDLAKLYKHEKHKSVSIFNRVFTRTIIPYFVRLFYYLKITPMQITVGRLILLPFSCYFLMIDELFLSGLIFFFFWALDHTDGALARVTSTVSPLGGFVDNAVDISSIILFLGLIVFKYNSIIAISALCVTTVGFVLLYLKLAYVDQINTRPKIYYRLLKYKIDLTLFFGGDAHTFWLCVGLMSGFLNLYLFYLILTGIVENINMLLVSIKQISPLEKMKV